uniref:RNA-directed RNA polymerase L n=1 Tax=Orthonairovirus haemorrhagiae TaxID=3052518 RepID=A0A1L3HDY6_9VIRU|nr:RNA-dependent RNA polymerase [Orthonairovirus haemorrhagiae]
MDFLRDLDWTQVIAGQYVSNPRFNISDYFEIVRQPGDGNCFYHSIAELTMPNKTDHSYHNIKRLTELAARKYYQEEPEARLVGLSLEDYLKRMLSDNEWGSTLEASMLAKEMGITIIIWTVAASDEVEAGMKFGDGDVFTAVNLLHSGQTHFDALRILPQFETDTREALSLMDRVMAVDQLTSSSSDELQDYEDLALALTSAEESHRRSSLDEITLSKKQAEILRQKASQLSKLVNKSQNIPTRVGRVLDCMFNCKLCIEISADTLILRPESKEKIGEIMSLRQLGHKLLTRDKQIKQEFSKMKLYVTKDLLDHLDVGGLLRAAFPGTGIERHMQLLHSEMILDICTVSLGVMLSTFLYGSNNKNKKKFITNCLLSTALSGKKVYKVLGNLGNELLYKAPRKALAIVCGALFGKQINKLQNCFRTISPVSLLALRNLDFDCLSVQDYNGMVENMSKLDNTDVEFNHREIADLNQLTSRLITLRKEKDTDLLKQWFPESDLTRRSTRNAANAEEFVISEFFKKKDIMKFISTSGRAMSAGKIGNVLSYAHNLYLSKSSLNMTSEDISQLLIEIKRLYALQEDSEVEPIAIICDGIESNMKQLFAILPPDCARECEVLFDDIRNSPTHSTAWKHALRLKGTAYEGLFANCYGWQYIPEDIKPSLTMLIQTLFPDKFEDFLDRTQLHPEFRDLTPDFSLTQKVHFKRNQIPSVENMQISIDATLPESVEAVPVTERKMFPLPETPLSEVHSIERIMENFTRLMHGEKLSAKKKDRYLAEQGSQQGTSEHESSSISAFKDYGERGIIEENHMRFSEEDQLETRQLLLVEVGFQTDIDGKIRTDHKKWKDILKLLELLGIKCSFIACADCSSTPPDRWWISEDRVRVLKNSVSFLFNKLSRNSPTEVTDIVVGAISTQKVRSYLKAGTATKTPVSTKDVLETWEKMKEHILNRPTGLTLPTGLEQAMRKGLVEGVVISKEGSESCINMLKENLDRITDEFERTKFKHELTQNITTSEKMLLSWLSEDIKSSRCSECLTNIKKTVDETANLSEKIELLAYNLQLTNHCGNCHPSGVNVSNTSNVCKRCPKIEVVSHCENKGFEDSNECLTDLDRLVRLTLPGKTEKERRVKRNVEYLIKLMMSMSGIDCIKYPTGQLITHGRVSAKHNEGNLRDRSDDDQRLAEKIDTVRKELSESKLRDYSTYARGVISNSLKNLSRQGKSKCSVPRSWLEKILFDLKVPTKDEEVLINIRNSLKARSEFVRNNDKLLIRSKEELKKCFDVQTFKLKKNKQPVPFQVDCILFKEVAAECMKRYIGTPYEGIVDTLVSLINVLTRFAWFQEVVLYGKICETFLRCCTEFNRSGVKLVKIRHCDINLSIKLPSNKKENMLCCLYSSNMELLQGPFYLNRRQAVLGSSYLYIVITLYIQVLQQYRCLEVISSVNEKTLQDIENHSMTLLDDSFRELTFALEGRFEESYKIRTSRCRASGNFLNRSSRDHFISVVSGLNLVYGFLIRDNLLANSQQQNKQLQMLRFGMLAGLSRLVCPNELGKKFSTSCRRIEDNIARLYLQTSIYCSVRDVEDNVKHWKQRDLCPEVTIPCFTVYGTFVNSDRQLIFDIYNVHIYNKEMDNFDEGCISVLEETAERHMLWELDLMNSLCSDEKKDTRTARLLLGCPNVRKAANREGKKLLKLNSDTSTDTQSIASEVSDRRSYSSSKSRIRSIFGRYNSQKKPFELRSGLEVFNDPFNDYQQAITDICQFSEYTPNKESVLKDCLQIIRKNPSHTMGSFELIQAISEFGMSKFPPENIDKARRDPKNWVSISEVTETTSIVASPRTHMMLKDCFKIILGTENKKIVKMLRGKLKKLGAISTNIEIGKRDCLDLLSTVDGLTDQQKENIVNGIFEPSKLSFYHWKELVRKNIDEVLLTEDGNLIFCWLKTISSTVKGSLKKKLRFMNVHSPELMPENCLFSGEEFNELIKLKKLLLNEQQDEQELKQDLLISSWIKCITACKDFAGINDKVQKFIHHLSEELYDIRLQHLELSKLKQEHPSVSFTKEEVLIKRLEKNFLKQHNLEIMETVNLIFFAALSAPWCLHYKALESYLVRHPEILDCGSKEDCKLTLLDLSVSKLLVCLYQKDDEELTSGSSLKLGFLVKYAVTLFTSNGEPFSLSLNDGGLDLDLHKTTDEKLLHQTKIVFAKIGLSGNSYDFIWTTQMIANSNFNVCKRLTGRSTGERLPRSVRSKVIYEMVKLVGETGMAILQQLAFAQALNYEHRFYAVLAPKAQLGGARDLLVQETGTKVMHATTEMFSRNLLKTTSDDGLTNPHLKETILNVGLDCLVNMRNLDGKPISEGSNLVNFYKVICISGDNTKWGPIHCCSFFSGMMQQVLKNVPDWCSFYKLTFIKNLCRQVEIPAGSIKKILNVLRYRLCSKGGVEQHSEEDLRRLLTDNLDSWDGNDTVKFLVTTYISKGLMALNSYNHMGQGIHHATSSVLTSLAAVLFEELAIFYLKRSLPQTTVHVEHAGSSDDYAKCIVVTGILSKELYSQYDETFWKHACRLKNFTAAVQRCCQMKDSAKTLVSDCFLEFYSEFMMGYRVTPAVIKFMFTGLINSSVTSPQSLMQACQVSSQQAMYNSVPLVTNTAFTLLRQQIFFNHVEDFIRRYGMLTLGTLSPFGRLFVPTYSGLVSSAVALEDAEVIARAAQTLHVNSVSIQSSSLTTLDSLGHDKTSSTAEDSSSVSDTTAASHDSGSSSSSFSFELNRPLSETELQFIKALNSLKSTQACEVIQNRITGLYCNSSEGPLDRHNVIYSSRIADSCDWLKDGKRRGNLELANRIQSILCVLIAGYYRSFGGEGTEKQVKASLNRDDNKIIEDPMIQLIPEKLRRELERLGVSRMEVDELMPSINPDDTLAQLVAKKLISLNVSTEEYSAEVSRLKQTLTARNVLHGLAGGIKELSLPIYTIFMKSYFFKDNVFLSLTDRWSTKHSTNYRDSCGKQLTGRIITKYTHWLDTFLGCSVSINRHTTVKEPSLFNPNIRCVNLITYENGLRELSVIQSHLKVFENEFTNLNLQFSDPNRQKLRIVESRPAESELEANRAVIVKTKLFSATEQVRLSNNPAVVMGYLLDESAISEVKPTKVDFSNLLKDRFKIMQFFPSVFTLIKMLTDESSDSEKNGLSPDLQQVARYSNHLTLLSRMIQQAKPTVTVFYMLKGNLMNTEPTVAELVSYGIKEGRFYRLSDTGIDASTYSVKYWKILHCISAIGCLPLSQADKSSLLMSFLNWRVNMDIRASDCPLSSHEASILSEFDGQVIANILASELSSVKRDSEREGLTDLLDYLNSPTELLKKKPYLGTTCKFNTWGDSNRSGKFTYSSRSGESIGIFIAGKLHIHLSSESVALLCETERQVLSWMSRRRTEVITKEQHQLFLSLLPQSHECLQKHKDGSALSVIPDGSNPRLLKFVPLKKGLAVVKIKKQILTVKKQVVFDAESEPRLQWGHGCLSIVYDETDIQTTYHENLLKVKHLVDCSTDRKKLLPQSVFSDSKVVLSRIKFKTELLLNSLTLLHCFLKHAPSDAIMEVESKSSLLHKYLKSGGVRQRNTEVLFREKLNKVVIKDSLEQGVEEEIEFCNNLTKTVSENPLPLSCWSEVQNYIEDIGFNNVLVNIDRNTVKSELLWKFTLDTNVSTTNTIKDIRTLVSYVGTETIPKFLLAFLLYEEVLINLINQCKAVKELINSTGLSDLELESLITLCAFYFQNECSKRDGPRCSFAALLSLVHEDWQRIGKNILVRANNELGDVSLKVNIVLVPLKDMSKPKPERVVMARRSLNYALSLMFLDEMSLPELKSLSVNCKMGNFEGQECFEFTILKDNSARLDYNKLIDHCVDMEKKREAVRAVEDLILMLTGKAVKPSAVTQFIHEDEHCQEQISLDDLMANDTVIDLPDREAEALKTGNLGFNWDSD